MKKLLLSLVTLVILGLPKVSAQIINADFETWTSDALAPNTKDPNSGNGTSGWWDFNMLDNFIFSNSSATVFKDSVNPSPENGRYCAKIISATMTGSAYSILQGSGLDYPQTNGVIVSIFMNFNYPNVVIKPGIPCNNELKSFSFYYRYVPNGGDTCSCSIVMYHFNSVTKQRDIVGTGFWSNSSTVTNWTQATVNINYIPDSTLVDTIFVGFSAAALNSANDPKINDTMTIDNASVVLGINNITAEHDNVTVYPNPANNQLNMAISGQFQAAYVEVYDITGNAIGTYPLHNNLLAINTQTYNSGIYFYKLLDNTGIQLNVGKFSVLR